MCGCSAPSESRSGAESAGERSIAEQLEARVSDLAARGEFSGAVLLSRGGRRLLRRGAGFADREAGLANTADTAFHLASVSKMFTAVVVAQLAEQHRLRFDQTIGSLLPDYPARSPSAGVTVGQLLTMSSGIPDVFRSHEFFAGFVKAKALSDFYKDYASAPLDFPPGSQWAYSNSNFLVLGSIVERILGRPFATVVEERVFRPAGMMRTSYRANTVPDVALGYTRLSSTEQKEWRPAWEKSSDDESIVGVSLGGGVSTVDDLARFAEALLDGRLVGKQMVDLMMTGQVKADYGGRHGYGFETRDVNGVRIAGHQGGFVGLANQVDIYRDLGYVFVVLGNSDSDGAQELAHTARSLITGARN